LTAPAPLCRLADLSDPGSTAFTVERDGERIAIMVIRRGNRVFGWVNSCPHAWVPLDIEPGQFLDLVTGSEILCANHGARFEVETGFCVLGPCKGKRLAPYPVAVREGMVVAVDSPVL